MELSARRELAQWWVVATALAWMVGGLLAGVVASPDGEISALGLGCICILGGAVLGVLQWLALRPHLHISLWWVAATAAVLGLLSYGAARISPAGLVLPYMPAWGPFGSSTVSLQLLVAAPIVGLLVGSVTGALLGAAQWLLLGRQRPGAGRWLAANVAGLGVGFAAGAVVFGCLMLVLESIDWPGGAMQGAQVLLFMAGMAVRGLVSGAITARALPPAAPTEPEEPGGATLRRARRALAWQWLAVTALAWMVGDLLAILLWDPFAEVTGSALAGILSGAVLGVLQWLVLRPHLRIGPWWVAASAAVLGLLSYGLVRICGGSLIMAYMPALFPPDLSYSAAAASVYLQSWVAEPIVGFVLGGVTGGLLGAAQWLLLGRQRPSAGRWLAANAVGLGAGFAARALVFACLTAAVEAMILHADITQGAQVLLLIAAMAVRGLVSGAITARALPPAAPTELEEPGGATLRRARRALAWQWLAIAALAWMVGGLLARVLWSPSPGAHMFALPMTLCCPRPDGEMTALALGGIVSGAVLGVLQWLVLRRHLRVSLWWAVATAAVLALLSYGGARIWRGGLTFPYARAWRPLWSQAVDSFGLGQWLAGPLVELVLGGVTGALLGAAQWLLFGRRRPGAGRWLAANAAGLGAGFAAGTVVLTCFALALRWISLPRDPLLAFTAGAVARGALSGAITAPTLVRLL